MSVSHTGGADTSLGIAFKGPEGIVLAADSRVTLHAAPPGQNLMIPATFDNATKLLRVTGQDFAGVVTYGLGGLSQQEPRTAYSFMPEFERALQQDEVGRLPIKEFAKRLSAFFVDQWSDRMPQDYSGPDMVFLVGGYDEGAPYGKVFEIGIPSHPELKEWHGEQGRFGPVWGGQMDYANRIFKGFDHKLPSLLKTFLQLADKQSVQVEAHLEAQLSARIPYQFLSLQDCVDLSVFLIRATIVIQSFTLGVRGVGGAIDVATITRTEGFKAIQQKVITGER